MTLPFAGGLSRSLSFRPVPTLHSLPLLNRTHSRADAAFVPAFAGFVIGDRHFRIQKLLHLQQSGRAGTLVARLRLAKHQPFAAECGHTLQFFEQVVHSGASRLIVNRGEGVLPPADAVLKILHAVLERSFRVGCVEDEVLQVFPAVWRSLTANDFTRAVELFARTRFRRRAGGSATLR